MPHNFFIVVVNFLLRSHIIYPVDFCITKENIFPTDSNIGEEFRNRKSVFSMNVQAVCDSQLILMNVVARWPGSTHDATIFNHSELRGRNNILYTNKKKI